MKILFSPSEAKSTLSPYEAIDLKNLLFGDLAKKRKYAIKKYQDFIDNASVDELKKIYGIKNAKLLKTLSNINILKDNTQKAVLRYSGVGYEYLSYNSLYEKAQNYLDENMIIFSNLFGAILAKDKIPYYKLKQGEKIGNFAFEGYYKKEFTKALDDFLEDEEILDLRAGFYEKFYKINQPYTTLKFIKNGKVVSHWAKAYRGITLKEMAKNNIQSIEELMHIQIKNLSIEEIKKQKNKTEIVCKIGD